MNGYFIASGIISVILSAGHTWWGMTNVIPEINKLSPTAMASFEVSWYQVGATLFVGGVALLIHAISRHSSKAIPKLVFSVYSVNFSVFLALVYLKYQFIMVQTATQLVLFTTMLLFLILGLWITPLSTRGHLTRQNINYVSVLNFRQKE
jgi:uncharacterized membrane protein HdeD (DUF308 family)